MPQEFLDAALETYKQNHATPLVHYPIEQSSFRFVIADHAYEWLRVNVCDDFHSAGIHTIENGDFGPHIDNVSPSGRIRYFSLIYPIRTGGDPYTNFYYTDQDMVDQIRKKPKWNVPRQDLTHVAGYQFQRHTWNLMNNQCLHSVDGLTSTRICYALNWCEARPRSLVNMGLIA